VGAHIGAFAVLAAHTWPQARILACEPDPDNLTLLRENLAGCNRVEIVPAALVDRDVSEVEFHAVLDKVGDNSGGGRCFRVEAGTVRTRVPALSVLKLWQTRGITVCDLLKLDCEGAEIALLRSLAGAGHLGAVRRVVGEWHAADNQPGTIAGVLDTLRS